MKWAVYMPAHYYTERANVPRTEEAELTNEESKINYTDLSNKSMKSENGIEYSKYTRVIETYAPIQFVEGDVIKFYDTNKTLKIKEVEIIVPKDKEKAVNFWGNQLEILKAKKRLSLQ